MLRRWPDKPGITMPAQGLATVNQRGEYLAQPKVDGWRTVIEITPRMPHRASFTSRHNKPIPITDEMRLRFEEFVERVGVPVGTLFDSEWVARRPAHRDELLVIFDVMQIGDEPLWGVGFEERYRRLRELVPNTSDADEWLVATCEDHLALWETLRREHATWAEGIVLKRRDSIYIGRREKSADNPAWIRCKWRMGESGTTIVA